MCRKVGCAWLHGSGGNSRGVSLPIDSQTWIVLVLVVLTIFGSKQGKQRATVPAAKLDLIPLGGIWLVRQAPSHKTFIA